MVLISNPVTHVYSQSIKGEKLIIFLQEGPAALSDDEVQMLVKTKHIPAYKLESMLGDHVRGINIRRQMLTVSLPDKGALEMLPYTGYDYKYVSTYLSPVCNAKSWSE